MRWVRREAGRWRDRPPGMGWPGLDGCRITLLTVNEFACCSYCEQKASRPHQPTPPARPRAPRLPPHLCGVLGVQQQQLADDGISAEVVHLHITEKCPQKQHPQHQRLHAGWPLPQQHAGCACPRCVLRTSPPKNTMRCRRSRPKGSPAMSCVLQGMPCRKAGVSGGNWRGAAAGRGQQRAAGRGWHSSWPPAPAPAALRHGPRGHHWLPRDDDQGRLGALLAAAVGGACHCRTPLLPGHRRCPGGAARDGAAAGPAPQAGRLLEGGCHCDHAADGLLPGAAGAVAVASCPWSTPGNVSGWSSVAGG